ncbi:flagellar motor switch phosphatase FliY [Lutispora saccharofermentans]|uniref:Flagellar motor switch phosphatase FliY n=1 Tax=Lutispora saccharofermentans TaxID=3024236 RepID=A0ABT1NBH9_9FIRM|nr:flagellar motor switch phosphatase FliY [Lutispora saccharofermentans]MCQ1527989.1 flagellar motor switch phosphatase FliY [Lutispora saccharofermentans]
MSDMLSQEEIDALLKGNNEDNSPLTPEEIDALGEIGNISMGTSATTLFTLLNNKVTITTPKVSVMTWEELVRQYPLPYVGVEVKYTEGFRGTNLLILKEDDVKTITDLMMGGDGHNIGGEINDLHLSAIGEAMNQMIGSSSTSLSSMFNKSINISPPKAFSMSFKDSKPMNFSFNDSIVRVAFKMEVEGILNSEIMQLIPVDFAKQMVKELLHPSSNEPQEKKTKKKEIPDESRIVDKSIPQDVMHEVSGNKPDKNSINVQPVQFEAFDQDNNISDKENIDLIMDVPLEITVELGRTKRLIKDILEFGPGTVVELDRLAGEPVDVIVNGKFIAKAEVVVIDESFGVRITDIISPNKRLKKS